MRLVQTVSDQSMMVSGYEHRTYECLACHEVERRLTFTTAPSEPEPPPAVAASVQPAVPPEPPPPSAWALAQEKVQARQADLRSRAELARQRAAAEQFHRAWDALLPPRTAKPARPAAKPTLRLRRAPIAPPPDET